METYQVNITGPNEKGIDENFFYQKFMDYRGHKVREIVRIVNEFSPEKSFEFKKTGHMTTHELDDLTEKSRQIANSSGATLNYELAILINAWIRENL